MGGGASGLFQGICRRYRLQSQGHALQGLIGPMKGKILYSPEDMNKAFRLGFDGAGWKERRNAFWVTEDEKIMRTICGQPPEEQKSAIEKSGHDPIMSYNRRIS